MEYLPQDLTQMTPEQTEHLIEKFFKMPLKELRRLQDLTIQQMEMAYNLKNEEALMNLHVRNEHFRLAIWKKCHG